ncbi:MAG: hypothetical protein JWL84_2139 [Rhodospirillales bacterium]|jgi:hypothetical protein|nr:hypothetical protein [Rhodospirillales bacterium]
MLSRLLRGSGARVISQYGVATLSIALAGMLGGSDAALAQGGSVRGSTTTPEPASSVETLTLAFGARLSGFRETPSIFTPANGTFEAAIDLANQELTYTLSYTGLSASVTVAHIHFGEKGVAGGVLAFLCGGGGKPACPQSGPVSGTIAAGDIMALAQQGVPAGSFQALFQAVVSGSAYANVHTSANPAGEIRGQIQF